VTTNTATTRIAPQTGVGFRLRRGDILRVIDVEGEQVSDLMAFATDGLECLSSGRTIDYNGTIYMTSGSVLYSNRSNQMLSIVKDTVGRHDFLFAPCSSEMFQKLYNFDANHPSCFANLAPRSASSASIPTAFLPRSTFS